MKQSAVQKQKRKLVLNVSCKFYTGTKYEVVRYVARRALGWNLSKYEDDDSWDVFWTDTSVIPERLSRMKPHQRINHFPGMYAIARKNHMAMNLNKLRQRFPKAYNFYPRSWVLPVELSKFKQQLKRPGNRTYIVKPESSSQGKGIFLIKRQDNIDSVTHCIVQEYLPKPLLIDGLKFDLRIYILVTSCDPLRIFIHEEGLARFATQPYEAPNYDNIDDACMHLTNYAINKRSKNFQQPVSNVDDSKGHKRSLSTVLGSLAEMGYDIDDIWTKICDLVIKTLCTIQPSLAHTYKSCQPDDISNAMCFEILGLDIILDETLKPWLLEVNHSPSFSTDSPLDRKIKVQVIKEALELLGLKTTDRKKCENQRKLQVQKRTVSGKSFKEVQQERVLLRNKAMIARDQHEKVNSGGYVKIYPCEDREYYDAYVNAAQEIWQNFTTSRSRPPSAYRRTGKFSKTEVQRRKNSSVLSTGPSSSSNINDSQTTEKARVNARAPSPMVGPYTKIQSSGVIRQQRAGSARMRPDGYNIVVPRVSEARRPIKAWV